jgi:hypothetical protein
MPNPKRLQPPWRGVTDTQPFVEQPGDACPPGALLNMRPRDVGTGRRRFGKRPAAAKTFDTQIGAGNPVQALTSVPKSVSQAVGPARTVTSGSSKTADLFRGQAILLDQNWAVRAAFNDDRSDPAVAAPPTGYGGRGAFNCCWDPDNVEVGFYVTITKNNTLTTQDVYCIGINRIDSDSGTVTHQGYAVDAEPGYSIPLPGSGQGDLFPNQIKCAFGFLFICAGTWVYVFDADDLTYRQRVKLTWADEVQGLDTVTLNGVQYLVALFTGSSVVTGPVVADSATPGEAFGQFVRSGVVAYVVTTASYLTGPIFMPQGTQSGDGAYEAHHTFRFSEYSKTRPRGCIAYGFAVDSLGDLFVGRTNQGFGYSPLLNASHRPDGSLSPYITVSKCVLSDLWSQRAAGTGVNSYIAPASSTGYGIDGAGWEVDTQSYRRAFLWNGGTYYNDIPKIIAGSRDPGIDSDAPSVYAVALDESVGQVYVGGRRPAPSNAVSNVYALRADDGTILWDHDVRGLVQQNAIDVDPTTGNVLVGFNRTDGWDNNGTPSTNKAEMLELDRDTGEVIRYFDLTDAVNQNTFATTAAGFGCYDVAVNARGQVLLALAPYRYDT